jgi:hypothetical protein
MGGAGDHNSHPTSHSQPLSASTGRLSPHRTQQNKNRNSFSSLPGDFDSSGFDTVANSKEEKETANLLSKIEDGKSCKASYAEIQLQKCDSGEYLDALCDNSGPAANTRSRAAASAAVTANLQQQQQQLLQHQQQAEMAASRTFPSSIPLVTKGQASK